MSIEKYRHMILTELLIFNDEPVDAQNDEYLFLLRELNSLEIPQELKNKMSWIFADTELLVYNKYLKLLEIIQDWQQLEIKED